MKRHFTIVELLSVVAVIAILAGILIPTIGAVKESGKATQSLTEVKSIHMAIKAFETDHKYLPYSSANNDTVIPGISAAGATSSSNPSGTYTDNTTATLDNSYFELFNTLCYTDHEGSDGVASAATAVAKTYNKQAKKYLAPNDTKKFYGGDFPGYRDPWGRPYIIFLDTNYDKIIENVHTGLRVPGNAIQDTAAVVGMGKNQGKTLGNCQADQLLTSWQ